MEPDIVFFVIGWGFSSLASAFKINDSPTFEFDKSLSIFSLFYLFIEASIVTILLTLYSFSNLNF